MHGRVEIAVIGSWSHSSDHLPRSRCLIAPSVAGDENVGDWTGRMVLIWYFEYQIWRRPYRSSGGASGAPSRDRGAGSPRPPRRAAPPAREAPPTRGGRARAPALARPRSRAPARARGAKGRSQGSPSASSTARASSRAAAGRPRRKLSRAASRASSKRRSPRSASARTHPRHGRHDRLVVGPTAILRGGEDLPRDRGALPPQAHRLAEQLRELEPPDRPARVPPPHLADPVEGAVGLPRSRSGCRTSARAPRRRGRGCPARDPRHPLEGEGGRGEDRGGEDRARRPPGPHDSGLRSRSRCEGGRARRGARAPAPRGARAGRGTKGRSPPTAWGTC